MVCLADGDGHSFDLYLFLLKRYKEQRSPVIEIDYKKAAQAREVAMMIDEGDSIESVEDFNRLFDLYGEDNVKMALKG